MLNRAGLVIKWRAGLSAMFTMGQNQLRTYEEHDAREERELAWWEAATVSE